MLGELVTRSAARRANALAVRGPTGTLVRRARREGQPGGPRVGGAGVERATASAIWLPKGAQAVAAMQGVLRLGAAYVPLDVLSPPARAAAVLRDCVCERWSRRKAPSVRSSMESMGYLSFRRRAWVGGAGVDLGGPGAQAHDAAGRPGLHPLHVGIDRSSEGGVHLPVERGRVRGLGGRRARGPRIRSVLDHAPFHFDLSVLDLYAAFSAGAAVCLVPEGAAYAAEHLVRFMHDERITVWYSVPSAITLMMEHGGLLTTQPDSLRALLFAGEPFPMKHLRRLREAWPRPRDVEPLRSYRNERLHRLPGRQPHRPGWTSVPIGRAVSGDHVWAKRADGAGGRTSAKKAS